MIGRKGEEGVYFEEPAGWRKPKAAKLCLFLKSYESKVLTRSVVMRAHCWPAAMTWSERALQRVTYTDTVSAVCVVSRCRELGAATAMLWVDGHPNMLAREDGVTEHPDVDLFDYHITPNTLIAQHYADSLNGRMWIIPQHNPNMLGLLKTNQASPVRIIGWQGSPENRMPEFVRVSSLLPARTHARTHTLTHARTHTHALTHARTHARTS
jgi:hypothetical protein